MGQVSAGREVNQRALDYHSKYSGDLLCVHSLKVALACPFKAFHGISPETFS